jgi:hypothetical protein
LANGGHDASPVLLTLMTRKLLRHRWVATAVSSQQVVVQDALLLLFGVAAAHTAHTHLQRCSPASSSPNTLALRRLFTTSGSGTCANATSLHVWQTPAATARSGRGTRPNTASATGKLMGSMCAVVGHAGHNKSRRRGGGWLGTQATTRRRGARNRSVEVVLGDKFACFCCRRPMGGAVQ